MQIEITKIEEIDIAAKEFIKIIGNQKVFAFNGKMGAGKTTFIKSICKELGVIENVNSPTFSIVNEYNTDKNIRIYHFDCYRLKTIDEALEMGFEEYLYSENLCFIEWSEKIEPLLPDEYTIVEIEEIQNGVRKVTTIKRQN